MGTQIPKSIRIQAEKVGLSLPSSGLKNRVKERFFGSAFDEKLRQTTPVIVYQMGKVASSSVYFSLQQVYPGAVLHAHTFQRDHEDWQIRKLFEQTILEGAPLNIISLTREPVGRNISAFFENFERTTGTAYGGHSFSTTQLRELFLRNYDHDIPLVWFDKNIAHNFDIDVYAMPFPDVGFETYTAGNKRLLVMKSEIEDGLKISAIRDFLNSPDFDLHQRNVGAKKEYADEYRLFANSVEMPPDYVEKMIHSKYFNHFYGNDPVKPAAKKQRR